MSCQPFSVAQTNSQQLAWEFAFCLPDLQIRQAETSKRKFSPFLEELFQLSHILRISSVNSY